MNIDLSYRNGGLTIRGHMYPETPIEARPFARCDKHKAFIEIRIGPWDKCVDMLADPEAVDTLIAKLTEARDAMQAPTEIAA